MKLNELLSNVNDGVIYIVDYSYWNEGKKLQTCKTCTIVEFLKELTEFEAKIMSQIIRSAKFRRF